MNPVLKWACIGAAFAFVQFFIFNFTLYKDWVNRAALGILGIVVYAVVGGVCGALVQWFRKNKSPLTSAETHRAAVAAPTERLKTATTPRNLQEPSPKSASADGNDPSFSPESFNASIAPSAAHTRSNRADDNVGYSPQLTESALSIVQANAFRGVAGDQYHLGLLYLEGNGVPYDLEEARKWIRLASKSGHAAAARKLEALDRADQKKAPDAAFDSAQRQAISDQHFMENATALSEKDEEDIYALVAHELECGKTDKGLWTRLYAENDGSEQATKIAYLKVRVARLMEAERARIREEKIDAQKKR